MFNLRRHHQALLILLAFLIVTPSAWSQTDAERDAARAEREEKMRQAKRERLWKFHYPKYAQMYQIWDGNYYFFPTYDPRQDSSLSKSVSELKRDFDVVYQRRTTMGVVTLKKTVDTPGEDYKPVMMVIPYWGTGSYGYFHSARVEKKEENGDVHLREVKLLDWGRVSEDRNSDRNKVSNEFRRLGGVATSVDAMINFRFAYRDRIRRFQENTVDKESRPVILKDADVDASAGSTWQANTQIAIISADGDAITAVPLKKLKQVRGEAEFMDILQGSGTTKDKFLDVVEARLEEALEKRLPADDHVREGVLDILGEKVPEGFNMEFDLDMEL